MNTAITIPKVVSKDSALSFDFLKEEAIQIIQELSGNMWTDHNTHDPGITILEQICYAITDIAYRLDHDMQDLLGSQDVAYQGLYSPATILTTSPVTLSDFRKLIIDTVGVRNAWIERVSSEQDTTIKGLYTVLVEKDDLEDVGSNLVQRITEKLHKNRGLCEDFEEIRLLDKQKIRFSGVIEISDATENINELIADVLYSLHWHLSPGITFHSLQELQKNGKSVEEIFDGPTLAHGFITDEELIKRLRKLEIHTSDIFKVVMDITNVITIQNFTIASGTNTVKNWVFPLDETKTPSLDVIATLEGLAFRVNGLIVSTNKERILALYNQKVKSFTSKKVLRFNEKDIAIQKGENQEIENYYSIQNEFPANYGIGNTGLPSSASKRRQGQSKQLTGYLTLFDQVLTNYCAQIANFYQLVGINPESTTTKFNQTLLGTVPGLENLIQDENIDGYEAYVSGETLDPLEEIQQKHTFLNHLLARYSETFKAYGMVLQRESEDVLEKERKLIQDKIAFLNNYPKISAERGKAFDYTKSTLESSNKSGLEFRILQKLGLATTENIYMVEHILLRPKKSDKTTVDNYYKIHDVEQFDLIEEQFKIFGSNHGLVTGMFVAIFDNQQFLGDFKVIKTTADSFEIEGEMNTEIITENPKLSWRRTDADLRIHVLTNSITSFETTATGTTFCNTKYQVEKGDEITILGSTFYDGKHFVKSVTNQGFEIEHSFIGEEQTKPRFKISKTISDQYTLQVTFILPNDEKKFQDQTFRDFVTTTIREETPVHITTHFKWLSTEEMRDFKNEYQKFIAVI
ncbi:hypothetical protein [Tenacibaculum jejuense]|uniref:Uncharacterized protein n=1 Tax=Tenacibaculum jejuense TaxID=584609 RepID=A0A238UCV8_9FLAO|nr:hypothetical protein [Tenacibaculum jejuense]SNR16922.1 protein of unknown function [Tenacibaculum jejuense]